ncbi:NACHT, LRR and PYD domains-containing protein 12 [Astyanax mexicanus]|uniref:NACHT, LRR and PYD domains-containing protein 12 n=1 Tax=Astyanax mexicanus TaxID=7994 RepID=UPI0020CB2109|nr:NACHT, LRR and PYD domains-containing protein 12 [Astyanax mexicanus]
MFLLPFRELNFMMKEELSLVGLLRRFFKETSELKPQDFYQHKVLFIFDGLDECRHPLDFKNNKSLSDITQPAPVDVLLTNLIKGNLLPSALLWITSRPAACGQIPAECVDQVTEIQGFSDHQKEEYFRKRISNQTLATRTITHMKSSRSLYIMCRMPVFCCISATVLERFDERVESEEIPKTLTQMFIQFLILQTKQSSHMYFGRGFIEAQDIEECVLKLGKLAFQQMQKGNLIFYEEDLRECGIDIREGSAYSGLCKQILKEFGPGMVCSFVHLSVQEFLAALFAYLSFVSDNINELQEQDGAGFGFFVKSNMTDFLKMTVDKALQSENGHLDLFLRFLLGLSLKSNQRVLQGILPLTGSTSENKEEIVEYIKEKIRENLSLQKTASLFHCLYELNEHSLLEEVQMYLSSGNSHCLSNANLSSDQWTALVFVLLSSEDELDVFDLSRYDASDECLLKLLPVVKASKKAELCWCNLSEESCAVLASALSTNSSSMRELDLSYNKLHDSGVRLLSGGLDNPQCKLEILKLCGCNITEMSCAALVSALMQRTSCLRELDMSNNKLQDIGIKLISVGLESEHCKVEILRLCDCNLSEISCSALASVLSSKSSSLRELDLSDNNLQDSGVKLLCAGLANPQCKLERLRLCKCNINEQGFAALALALISNPSPCLRELDLSYNIPGVSGVQQLSDLLRNTKCKLEKLQLQNCSITDGDCAVLALTLNSNSSSFLKELDLTHNNLGESGINLLSALVKNPHCKLEKLLLCGCNLTKHCCAALASVLSSNSSLRELDLSENNLDDSGVKDLCAGLHSIHCKLETLGLYKCCVGEEGFAALASALSSSTSCLKKLNVKSNKPGKSGKDLLTDLVNNTCCKLKNLCI